MASGVGFQDYRQQQQQTANPNAMQIGQQMAAPVPPEPELGESAFAPDVEHSSASTEAALREAIAIGLRGRSTPQQPSPASPANRHLLRALGVPDVEIELGNQSGLWEAP